jgi:hypothetical protein
MTRPDQKIEERRQLNALLAILNITPDDIDDKNEKPDFILIYSGKAVGVELTTYRPKTTRPRRRQIEAEWDVLRHASREFQAAQPDIRNINVRCLITSSRERKSTKTSSRRSPRSSVVITRSGLN